MIFISTCSQDSTTDIVVGSLRESDVFRFNIDKPEDFSWDFHANGFVIEDKVSKKAITDRTMTSFYLRKPMYFETIDVPKFGCMENWRREETDELFADFFRECQARGLTTLVRSQNNKFGKLRQMLVARDYFKVAPWHFFHGIFPQELEYGRWVVKTLTSTPIGKGKVLFVREIAPNDLDLAYPWFLQERIDGQEEVTVSKMRGSSHKGVIE